MFINRFNGGIKRKPFFIISFLLLGLGFVSFTVLYSFAYINPFYFDTWTIAFLIYFFAIDAFALLTTLIRTFADGKYCCKHCKRFGLNLFGQENLTREMGSYQKPVFDMHSRDVYAGTEVTTHTEWKEADGKMVEGSLKTNVTMEDKYTKEYYAVHRLDERKYVTTKGTICCKKCGAVNSYWSIDHI